MSAVTIEVSTDGQTGQMQLSINKKGSHGYRISGPKFTGSSRAVIEHALTERDIAEIEMYLAIAKKAIAKSGADQ